MMNGADNKQGDKPVETNTRPAAYDDFCECGHRLPMHVETDTNYAPCSADDCSCDDYDERN